MINFKSGRAQNDSSISVGGAKNLKFEDQRFKSVQGHIFGIQG
jgi:hypothetical protein